MMSLSYDAKILALHQKLKKEIDSLRSEIPEIPEIPEFPEIPEMPEPIKGDPGPPGESVKGDPGDPGQDGVGIDSVEIDPISGHLLVYLTDGSLKDVGSVLPEDEEGNVTIFNNVTSSTNAGGLGKQTLWIPAQAMAPTVSNGCAAITDVETTAGRPDMSVLDFDATADEHAQFSVAFPAQWNEGTVTFQAYWTTTATDTDGVAWGLQGVACSDGDTLDVAYGTAVVVTDAGQSTAEDLYITAESGAVTIAGTPAAGDLSFFRIFRDVSDAADVATEDARLIGVKLFWTNDALVDA